ncbi:putative component of the lipoprotein assembly complex (forms a complex with YaeT, YfgL, and NlpB) [Candidatus Palibaumannia cicadellinicola]|uniref:Outer membrane protein assembly factor BamD n=2 Tax=Candidatus Palibaumannia cicadellinicola TaxID=186490 RepID=A0A088MXK8_9GAMM|nr:putative component of the lipoprotein assembly complex (forms a complex with YaeT, YfgL, and NlpB) [Candidatus Baumannia cicadellinicola]
MILVNCSSNTNAVFNHIPSEVYTSARQKLQDGYYKEAIKELEILDNYYTLGTYTQQIQLDLIYTYYKLYELKMSQIIINRFLHTNPNHPNIDYVLYIRGLINMVLDESALPKLLFVGFNNSEQNPEYAHAAFRDFYQLIYYYPYSQYAIDAKKHFIYLKDRLAKYELSVVKYYHKRGAYIAVVNRVEQMLRHFPDTNSTYQALPYMENAYQQLQLNGQAEKVANIIRNFFSSNL